MFQIQKRGERSVEVQPQFIGYTQWLVPAAVGTSATG